MRIIVILFISFFIPLFVCCQGKDNKKITEKSQADTSFLAYNGNFHEEIIKPEVRAWQKVMGVIFPRVCDDAETQWAAHKADSLAHVLLANKFSKGEQIARLNEIQDYIVYGMSYFSAMLGLYTNPDIAEYALSILKYSSQDLLEMRRKNFNDFRLLITYEQLTFFGYSWFMQLSSYNANSVPSFVEENKQMIEMTQYLIYNLLKDLKSSAQIYRYSYIILNTAFFKTFFPLAFWFSTEEFRHEKQAIFLKIGTRFDEWGMPIVKAVEDSTVNTLPELTTDQFTAIVKESSSYKISIIEILAEAIRTLPLPFQN